MNVEVSHWPYSVHDMPDQKLHTSLWYTILGSPLDYYWEYSLDLSWQYLNKSESFLSIHYPCSLPLNVQLQIVHVSRFIAFSCRAWISRALCLCEYSFQLFLFLDCVGRCWSYLSPVFPLTSHFHLCWYISCCRDTFYPFTLSSCSSTFCLDDWSLATLSCSALIRLLMDSSSQASCTFSAMSEERISEGLNVMSQLFLCHLSIKIFLCPHKTWEQGWIRKNGSEM